MNDYWLTVFCLFGALSSQALVAGTAVEIALRKSLPGSERKIWIALAIGGMLFALYHGYSLELALKVGLYDLRQAILALLAGALTALAVSGFRRRVP